MGIPDLWPVGYLTGSSGATELVTDLKDLAQTRGPHGLAVSEATPVSVHR